MAETTELLGRVSIFKGLTVTALEQLGSTLKGIDYPKDALIVGQEDQGDALYIIERGRVKVVLFGEGGRDVILTLFRDGDFFGEMSLLDGQPRSASVVAVENTRVLRLSRDDFRRHLESNPTTSLNILAEMCTRMRFADEVIGNLALLDVYGRVARTLIGLADKDGEVIDAGILIRERPTQQDLASMIGTSRETVSRVISEFARRGFLSIHGKSLVLSQGFARQSETFSVNH